ncbi:hypothetical protein OS493_002178 [Desmophyllum pertusum]|uniref:UBZ1-type domain-containing protein n=1 Tax=Desmophyllum pertusum TaxID=174260 RepID=A0A9W9Z8F4_9CNID|nr:hypothetical protein OS493_002178 [Desmophyllum pertusum]
MERKVIVKEELASPRVDPLDEEDVFDYPGLEDVSSGTGPVPRDAHIALKEAFESVKKRLLEAQVQNSELKAKLKRDRKGSHERVYHERDELLSHLQKSYLAFKEKYGENEQTKEDNSRTEGISEIESRSCSSVIFIYQGEVAAQPGPSSEEEDKLEKKRYTTIMEELKTIGLEVIEENEIKGSTSEDKAVETEAVITRQEGYEQVEGKRKRVEAEVIFLKQKVEDQTQELNRFYKIFKEVMARNKILSAREQRKEVEGGNAEGTKIQRRGEFERVLADDAPLSIPVQESELHRLKRSGEAGEVIYGQRLSGEINLSPSSSVLSRGAEGRAVAMTTFLSENTGTGESDIEVIEEEEDFIGATPSRGKICPICERFFPDSYGQEEFELHVNQHFAE